MNKRPVIFFLISLIACFMTLSAWEYFKGKKTKESTETLEEFKSDLFVPGDKDALIGKIIDKKKKFIAYGTYILLPAGKYIASFRLVSKSSEPVDIQLQIAVDRGKSIVVSEDLRLDHFPVSKDLSFQIAAEKEIEPRVLYSSGDQRAELKEVSIRRLKGIFPWVKALITAILFAVGCTLILMASVKAFGPGADWKYYLAGFLFLAGCFLILQRAWISEDAFITLRHVDNFIAGHGPVFNVSERVEGFTHPLWFGVLTLFRWIGFSPKGAAVLPGLLASLAALYLLFFRIRIIEEGGRTSFLNPAAAILIGTSAFIDFGTSGLETALSYLLLVLYAKFLLENRWRRQPFLTGLIVSFLILNRPDFGIFLVLLFIVIGNEVVKKNIQLKFLVQFLAFPVLLVGGYQIFRMGYYAAFFPNPFYAKSGAGVYWSQGFKYLLDLFQGSLTPVILIFVPFVFFSKKYVKNRKARLIVLFSGLIHGFFVIRGGGDFMHGRFLLPAFLLITLSFTGALDRFFDKKTALKLTCIAGCLILFFGSLSVIPMQKRGQPFHNNISNERFFYYKNDIVPLRYLFTDTMILIWKTIGINYRNLAERAKMPIRIAYKNVGFTGYYSGPRVYVCDTLGLSDPVVSRIKLIQRKRPGHEKNAPFGYLILRDLTFHETPFILWNRVANTKFGILWDLSPKTINKLDFFLDKNFKEKLDSRIIEYLNGLEETALPQEADFLFFLKQYWFPYATKDHQQAFLLKYHQDVIDRASTSFQWIQKNRAKIDVLLAHIQEPLDLRKFLGNIGFALNVGRTLSFSPTGEAAE